MRWPLQLLIALFALLRRRVGRLRARRLLAQGLERTRALLEGNRFRGEIRPALREPLALPEPPAGAGGEYRGLRFSAQAIRSPSRPPALLLRLSALPREPRSLAALEPARFGLDESLRPRAQARPIDAAGRRAERRAAIAILSPLAKLRASRRSKNELASLRLRSFLLDEEARPALLAEPLPTIEAGRFEVLRVPRSRPAPRPIEAGAARPDKLGLDEAGLPPSAREPPPLSTDREPPPRAGRYLEARLPLPRAPIRFQLDWRAFRGDPVDGRLANEELVLPRPDVFGVWLLPTFYGEVVEVRHLETRFLWPPPLDLEWYLHWLQERRVRRMPGGKEAAVGEPPEDIAWCLDVCKEQMLIRRDVPKDEQPPVEPPSWTVYANNPGILVKPRIDFSEFMKPKEWIETSLATLPKIDRTLFVDNLAELPRRQRLELLAALEEA